MSSSLDPQELARLTGETAAALATIQKAAEVLSGRAKGELDIDAARAAVEQIEPLTTRLRARGSGDVRTKATNAMTAAERLLAGPMATDLIRLLMSRTPIPGGPAVEPGGPSVIDLAEFYLVVTQWIMKRAPQSAVLGDLKRVAQPFMQKTQAYLEAAEAELNGPDHPDLGPIAANLLRLDVLTWMLVSAGFQREAAAVQTQARRLARSAMRRASAIMAKCAATFSVDSRVGLAGMIAEIDDLVLIFRRVLDGEREERVPGETTFVQSLGTEAIAEFAKAMSQLANGIKVLIANKMDAETLQGREIGSLLRVLAKMQQLFIGLDGGNSTLAMTNRDISDGLINLSHQLANTIVKARTAKDDKRLEQLEIIRQAFADYGEMVKGPG